MEKIVDYDKCCGCHACYSVCPKGAIEMIENEKGFKYPIIDTKKCINCGLCKKICPVINSKENEHRIESYACYNNNLEERIASSSGGIFVLLAKEIIKRKGIVFGACFNNEYEVVHSYCDNENNISKFMGSKYTQSSIGDTFKKVKEILDKDKYVLFTGTPCQIEGLKSFLRKDYDKLYTQDIICHGVPSPKLWRKYLKYQVDSNKENINNISFRSKDHGWSLYRMKVLFDTKTYSESFNNDLFMKAFLNNTCLRDSCYECSFKKKYRISDITLADYWGIKKIHPDMDDDKGTSLIVINSKKGEELFELIKDNIIYKKTDLDKAVKYNIAMIKSASHSPNEKLLFDSIDNMSMEELVNNYVPKPSFFRRIKNIIKRVIKK